jgi:hypothetical protein
MHRMKTFSPPVRIGFPLSGNVDQTINPWTWIFSPTGNRIGLINVDLGLSRSPEVEAEILARVGSYGRQIGRIGEAVEVLLRLVEAKCDPADLTPQETAAIADFRETMCLARAVKKETAPG